MPDLEFGDSPLRKQIRQQVDRCGEVIKGDLEGVDRDSKELYVSRVVQSVKHLEDLSRPYQDEEYRKQLEELDHESSRKNTEVLNQSSERFEALVLVLHRQGVI